MKRTNLMLMTLLAAVPLSAQQEHVDYDIYRKNAGDAVILYRGRAAVTYPMSHNGTYYLDSPAFVEGDLHYNGKTYYDVLLNVDAVRQDLLVKKRGGVAQIRLSGDYVDWFTMGDRLFVNLEKQVEDAPAGWFEVIYDGSAGFYRQTCKSLESDLNGNMKSSVGVYKDTYNPDVHNTFVLKENWYYLPYGGKLVRVRSIRGFMRQLPKSWRKEVAKYMEDRYRGDRLTLGEYAVISLKYLESR